MLFDQNRTQDKLEWIIVSFPVCLHGW